jgi:hypothetical protein
MYALLRAGAKTADRKRRRRKREKTEEKNEAATKKRGKREERDATHQKREPYIFFSFSSS